MISKSIRLEDSSSHPMSNCSFRAVIFDLDGVITDTATSHAKAWKTLFDDYLKSRAAKTGEDFFQFSVETDYTAFIDGKPRYEGVESFLNARGITLPVGDPTDSPGEETICSLGNQKNDIFCDLISREGVEVFCGTTQLVRQLKKTGISSAVASSSKNCQLVLSITGLGALFKVSVDGVKALELGLRGKPFPDMFVKCCEYLGTQPELTVIVEDSEVGVQAGRAGEFGLVIGIDRAECGTLLSNAGADVVVRDLQCVAPRDLEEWWRIARRNREEEIQ